jgi:hypothetical protein
MLLGLPPPVGVKDRLFVRLIVRLVAPVVEAGTVITIGDQTVVLVVFSVAVLAAGLSAAQVTVPVTPAQL